MAGESASLPSLGKLTSSTLDYREAFVDVRNWVKARQHQQSDLAGEADKLSTEHRKALFSFLLTLPSKKPLFASQARELLLLLSEQPAWVRDGALKTEDLKLALAAPKRPSKTVSSSGGGAGYPQADPRKDPIPGDQAIPGTVPEAPSPPRPGAPMLEVSCLEELPSRLPDSPSSEPAPPPRLQGFPPLESFRADSKVHDGDTFKDLRKWAKTTPVWDLAEAARQLPSATRADVFRFLTRIGQKKMYSAVAREVLTMLLSVEEWGEGIVDPELEGSISSCLASPPSPPPPPAPKQPSPEVPAPAVAGQRPLPQPQQQPNRQPHQQQQQQQQPQPNKQQPQLQPQPQQQQQPRPPPTHAPIQGQIVSAAARGPLSRAQLEAILRQNNLTIKDPNQLPSLYLASGLGCQASLSGRSRSADTLRLMFVLGTQRMRDYFTDDLQRYGRAVHFPHLHVDLTRRSVTPLPSSIQKTVEGKIQSKERWTGLEKAWVLSTTHELSLLYMLAYAASRATAAGRGCIWISMVMKAGCGSEGHANGIILILGKGSQEPKALIYDPNFSPSQEHWVHALKAVNDTLPKVRQMLTPVGIDVPSKADLFGHALQTNLGTVTTRKAWFSSTVYSTRRGYPICGAVTHLLASLWAQTGGHDNIEQIEALLSEIVTSGPEGKALVQGRLAGVMKGLEERQGPNGQDPFDASLCRRLALDAQGLPHEAPTDKDRSSLTIVDGHGRRCNFSWP